MRLHILGLGSIGTLLGYHLRRNALVPLQRSIPSIVRTALANSPSIINNYTLTLHLKSYALYTSKFLPRGLGVTRGGSHGRVGAEGFRVEVLNYGEVEDTPSHGPSIVERINPKSTTPTHPDAIDSMIVTTKADSTTEALRPFVDRLTSASTVVLLQNGMGILDEVIESLWPDVSLRPHFIVGNLTHGVYAKGAFDVIHAGYGALRLGIVPNDSSVQEVHFNDPSPLDIPTRRLLSNLNIDASLPPTNARLVTLRATLLHLLALPLDVHWEPLDTYNISALRKLAVNACINPTSAIFKLRNGELQDQRHGEIQSIWRGICNEAADVFAAVAGRSAPTQSTPPPPPPHHNHPFNPTEIPNTPYLNNPLYDARALLSEARSVARQTAENYSSMYIDVHGDGRSNVRAGTEVQYMNGYISRLGRVYGIETPVNDEMVRRVMVLKDQAQIKRDEGRVIERGEGVRWVA